MSLNNIIFKVDCDSGKYAGTGHLSRILIIYKLIKKKYKSKYKYYFLISNFQNSKKILLSKINEKFFFYDKKFEKNLSFLSKNDIIVNDTPKGIDKKFYNFCQKKKIKKVISFDDVGPFSQKNYIVINSISFFKKKITSSKNKKIFQGAKYILLNEKYLKKKTKVRNKKDELSVLVCTGGADYKNLLYKISNFLSYFNNLTIYVVIGTAVKKNNPIHKLNKKNIIILKNKNTLIKFFNKVHFSIVTGGITMFESLATNTTTLVYQSYFHQSYAINYLNKMNNVITIGKEKKLFKSKLKKTINKLMRQKKITRDKNNNYIDAKGILRTKKILFNFLKSK